MNLPKIVFAVTTLTLASLFSACATHTVNGKNHTVVLGGLVDVHEGAYEEEPAATLPVNTEKPMPGSKLNGNKVSVLWGLISYRNQ